LLITVGGSVLGLLLLLVSLVILLVKVEVFLGGLEQWRKGWYWLALVLLTGIGGLAVLFATLHMLRGQVRESPTLRRLIYGYNAVVTGILLLVVLAVLNFLVYVPTRPFTLVNATYDWTRSNLYSLDEKTKKFLDSLDQPVEINVLLPGAMSQTPEIDFVAAQMRALKTLLEAASDKVKVFQYSPDHARADIERLETEYGLPETQGVFVIYGTKPDHRTALIPYDKLFEVVSGNPNDPTDRGHLVFRGEGEVLSQMRALAQAARQEDLKKTLYFTQGQGEPEITGLGHFGAQAAGLGQLREHLEKAGYKVEKLSLVGPGDKVPEDAAAVVVVGPRQPFAQPALDALGEYMGVGPAASGLTEDGKPKPPRKGKMVVLFDFVPGGTQTLEGFVSQFGVQVKPSRLLNLNPNAPTQVQVMGPWQGPGIPFTDVRPLETNTGTARQQGFTSARLFWAFGSRLIEETNLGADPAAVVRRLMSPDAVSERAERLLRTDPTVGAMVSETTKGEGEEGKGGTTQYRLMVVGDSTWVSNGDLSSAAYGEFKTELFLVFLARLLERPDPGGDIKPKSRSFYVLGGKRPNIEIPPRFDTSPEAEEKMKKAEKEMKEYKETREGLFWKIATMPVIVVALSIIGLGFGVWVLRRR
jgi:hypothetical protein